MSKTDGSQFLHSRVEVVVSAHLLETVEDGKLLIKPVLVIREGEAIGREKFGQPQGPPRTK